MSKKAEILFASFIFLSAIAFVVYIVQNFKVLFVPLDYQPTSLQTIIFLVALFLGFAIGYIVITVFVNVFLKKCNCCKGRGLVKKVILADQYTPRHEKEYELCFECRQKEAWRHNEEMIIVNDYSIIHIPFI